MTLRIITTTNSAATSERLAAGVVGNPPVWLMTGYAQVLSRRKRWAASACSLCFGATVSTFTSWVADAWELYGDGRMLVSPMQRTLLVQCALDAAVSADEVRVIASTAGMVELIADTVKEGAGFSPFMKVIEEEGFKGFVSSDAEDELFGIARRYFKELEGRHLCEWGQALSLLSETSLAETLIVCEGFTVLDRTQALFFARLAQKGEVVFVVQTAFDSLFDPAAELSALFEMLQVEVIRENENAESSPNRAFELESFCSALFHSDADHPVAATGAVRFLLPAGRYATASLVTDMIADLDPTETRQIIVACNDPAALFYAIAPRLERRGIAVATSYRRRFGEVAIGRAIVALFGILTATSRPDTFQATDYALSPLSDMGVRMGYILDAKWRSKRIIDREGILDDLCDYAPDLAAPFIGSFEAGHPDEAIGIALQFFSSHFIGSEAFRSEQLSALASARKVLACAEDLGFDFARTLPFLMAQSISVHTGLGKLPCVHFMTLSEAARGEGDAVSALIVGDLNASDRSIRSARTSKDLLFEKLGWAYAFDPVYRLRSQFFAACSLPADVLVLERTLNDEQAEPSYPAVVFEDAVDCYRCSPADARELDRTTGLPDVLAPYAMQAGEECFSKNFCDIDIDQNAMQDISLAAAGRLSPENKDLIVVSRAYNDGLVHEGIDLSPSAIESYLECPYKWFSLRRLSLDVPDAGFGGIEKGNFAHTVLQRFYQEFPAKYKTAKPIAENLTEAQEFLGCLFDEEAARQPQIAPSRNPLIALTPWEMYQLEEMKRQLQEFLVRDSALLPGFAPTYFEWQFGHDAPISYAGVNLLGQIDRIDINDRNQAVIVDYKSSLNPDYYALPVTCGEFVLPHKIQTLIYAQVVRRVLGLDVVGALYTCVLKPGLFGAYDGAVLGGCDLPGINEKRNGSHYAQVEGFSDLLDRTEALIFERLLRLQEGDICPNPRTDKSCDYCPVTLCEVRDAR
ncbi:MAG: PD-(D/E)XK nuclease family protein [Raoultibacter sp.]